MTEGLDTICWLLDKTRALGADGADAVLFETIDSSASWRLGKPEGIERAENRALGLRAFFGAQQAIVSSTDIHRDALAELAERAVAMAKVAPADPSSTLAPTSRYVQDIPDLKLYDPHEPDTAWMLSACQETEEAAMSVKGITNSEGADAQCSRNHIHLAIAGKQGVQFAQEYNTTNFSVSISVVGGTGTGMERDYDFTSARYLRDLTSPAIVGKSASERTLLRMNPRKVPTCQAPVVFDPRVSRSLLSVLAGAISGSSVARGSSFLKDSLSKQIFRPGIRIIDDPHVEKGLGSRPFDAEGVRNERRVLVEDGVLQSWLLDMRSANKLGLETTGHATRGIASPPSPSSSNLFMSPGTLTPDELIADIKSGLYLTETFGMGINTVTGDYSQGAAGFWIENGEIAYPVSEITIAGRLGDMFAQATPANDLVLRYATNAPTLRIETMTVAGT